MKRIWHKARAARLSIHGPKNLPLIAECVKRGPTSGVRTSRGISFSEFAKFFREFVKKVKPEPCPDIYDLYKYTSLGRIGGGFWPIKLTATVTVEYLLPRMLLLRSFYLIADQDEERATEFTVRNTEKLAARRYLPFDRKDLMGLAIDDWVRIIMDMKPGSPDYEKFFQEKLDLMRKVRERLQLFYDDKKEYVGVETTLDLDPALLEWATQFIRRKFEPERSLSFSHPDFSSRLVLILGNSIEESFDAYGCTLFDYEDNRVYMDEINLTESPIAVIGMYPWEADHLEKAEEMSRRGIPAPEPLGKLFVDELEFALFRWIKGETLAEVKDTEVWREYGSVIRECHEKGIMINDAAGRNAIWTGSEVKIIDLEHTLFAEETRSLDKEERTQSLSRIKEELEEKKKLLNAFMRGYRFG